MLQLQAESDASSKRAPPSKTCAAHWLLHMTFFRPASSNLLAVPPHPSGGRQAETTTANSAAMSKSPTSAAEALDDPTTQVHSDDNATAPDHTERKSQSPTLSEASTIILEPADHDSVRQIIGRAASTPDTLHTGDVGISNQRTDSTYLPSQTTKHDPLPGLQASRPPFRPFANHQGAAAVPTPGPVKPTFGALADLKLANVERTRIVFLPRTQVAGVQTVPPEQVFYSIKVQHYVHGQEAPLNDVLTPLARTPEAAIGRLRAETEEGGLFEERRILSIVYWLDGTFDAAPDIEGSSNELRDVVHAVIMQTWVGEDGASSLVEFVKRKGIVVDGESTAEAEESEERGRRLMR